MSTPTTGVHAPCLDEDVRVDALVSAARALCDREDEWGRARELFEAALALEPARLEVQVELAALEFVSGERGAAQARMQRVGEHFSYCRSVAGHPSLSSSAESWDDEIGGMLSRHPRVKVSRECPAPPSWPGPVTARRRNDRRIRYSIPTLRARVQLRLRRTAESAEPERSLAQRLRDISRRARPTVHRGADSTNATATEST